MKQIYERKDTYVVSWDAWGNTIEVRFDNIPDAGMISDKYGVITRVDIEMGDLVRIGA